jgi:CRP-like cAMP-binding protein
MATRHPSAEQLAALAPLARLPRARLDELAELSLIEQAPRGADALKDREPGRPVFLVRGEVLLAFNGGGTLVVVGGTGEGCRPLNRGRQSLLRSKAITDVELVTLDDDFLDVLKTWDQAAHNDAQVLDAAFALKSLKEGALAQVPAAQVEALIKRSQRLRVARGELVVREGDEGDDCYLVVAGRFQVERIVGGAKLALAELKSGDAFGEEALVSEAKRNATVTALTDGELLRARRADFNELLREPLLKRLSFDGALRKVAAGALWLDVRYPSEYQQDKLAGAINVPLAEVRNVFAVLDRSREYVAYCQSGRRSAAAAFLFAQRGFRVWLLEGGLKQAAERRS